MIISFMDTFTSLLAGVTIFSILGNLAHERGVTVDQVAGAGSGLAFISYPDAIAKFDSVAYIPQVRISAVTKNFFKRIWRVYN